MALYKRKETGEGQCIDAALYEGAFNFMEPYVPAYEKLGFVATRTGSRLPDNAPNNLYTTKDGRHIHVAAVSEPTWRRLMTAIGREDALADPRFATFTDRATHEDAIDEIIGEWAAGMDLEAADAILQEAGVPASRIYTMADVYADPHYAAREMLTDVPDDDLGSVRLASVVPKLSGTPGRIDKAGGQVGVDTQAVLAGFLDMSEAAISALEADGVIFCGAAPGAGTD
jgi:crotonobetainyl-CoA:carnitine CoA-transferase CaiB-like acyl-CoA transferase